MPKEKLYVVLRLLSIHSVTLLDDFMSISSPIQDKTQKPSE